MDITNQRYLASIAGIKLVKDSGVLGITEEDLNFLMQEKPWINTDRVRARQSIEAACYGAIDYLGFDRLAVPAEFIAGSIAYFVHPTNIQGACRIMEGAEWCENVIQGVERPVRAAELFAHTLQVLAGIDENVETRLGILKQKVALGL